MHITKRRGMEKEKKNKQKVKENRNNATEK